MALEPGDPISYASHYHQEPFEELGGEPINILLMPTPGDMIVSINTGIALARAAGMVNWTEEDDRYGMSVNEWLIDTEVVRGLDEHGPWTNEDGVGILFDPDDLDNGTDDYNAPSDEPLRIVVETDAGVSGLRMPYVSPYGSHGFALPEPSLGFDIHSFAINQIARYLQTGGQEILDDPCLESGDCDFLPILEGNDDAE